MVVPGKGGPARSLPLWEGGAEAGGGEGNLAQARAGGGEDGVGDGRGGGDRGRFAGAECGLVGPVEQDDVDVGYLREGQDWVAVPVQAGHSLRVKTHFLLERAAERLQDVAF